jgi:hypothetical protein
MSHELRDIEDRRGLRFAFDGEAEVTLENPPRRVHGRVTELSFRGCFVQMVSNVSKRQRMKLKVQCGAECMEAVGEVMYVRPEGVAVLFDELEPQALNVLQDWILNALDVQAEAERGQEKQEK